MIIRITAAIFLLFFSSQPVHAETKVQVQAAHEFGPETSENEACGKAVEKAKRKALMSVVGEKMTTSQIESCTDNGSDLNCTLFEETISFSEGGRVTGVVEELKPKITSEFGKQVCSVSFTAIVEKIPQKTDPSYFVEADVLPSIVLRDGEEAEVQIKITKPSFIYLYGWFPDVDERNLYLISEGAKFHNKLIKNKETLFPAKVSFPKGSKKEYASEQLIIVASKQKMPFNSKIDQRRFFKMLGSTPRDSWELDMILYKILRNK